MMKKERFLIRVALFFFFPFSSCSDGSVGIVAGDGDEDATALPDVQKDGESSADIGEQSDDDGVHQITADLCVYGASSAGVMAAYAASRMGVAVLLVEPGLHVGGMSANGLGHTDVGQAKAITGLAADFYQRVGSSYGSAAPVYDFEPHVAEQVFQQFVQQAGFAVLFGTRIKSVTSSGGRIRVARFEAAPPGAAGDTDVFASIFIDATYEGDLVARAGVSYVVGRESNATFGETLNGVQLRTQHQFPDGIDPYVTPGDPGSGLLPGINPEPKTPDGTGDGKVQAYNFRLCMTKAAGRIPIPAPVSYDSSRYELLGRTFAKVPPSSLGAVVSQSVIPNGKYDWNNKGPVSTDWIGANWDYPESAYAERDLAYQAHQEWTTGLFHFLATDTRVPAALRSEIATWGFCGDEFADNGGWPHQLYVREARRLVGSSVMTERNCTGEVVAEDAVAFGSYTMDSHNVQRVVVGGMVKNEGDVQVRVNQPYGISYGAITPRKAECGNLLVPVCLSASHIAYGSIRMEPVFMALGQASGVAAALAIAGDKDVQDVDVDELLSYTSGLIMDSETPGAHGLVTLAGSWQSSQSERGYIGKSYYHDGNANKGTMSATFTPHLQNPGTYAVYVLWTANPNRATNVPVSVYHSGGPSTSTVDQQTSGGQWILLGDYPFAGDGSDQVVIRNEGTNGYVIVDAVRFAHKL